MTNSGGGLGSSGRESRIPAVVWLLFAGILIAAGGAPSAIERAATTQAAPVGTEAISDAADESLRGPSGENREATRGDPPVGGLSKLSPFANFRGTFDYVARGAAMRNQGYGTIFVSWPGSVVAAYLVWAFMADTVPRYGTLNGVGITGTLHASNPVHPCWSSTIHTLFADVTAIVVNGHNSLSGFPSGLTSGADPWATPQVLPLLQGAALIVIYDDGGPLHDVSVHLGANTIQGPGSLEDTIVHVPARSNSVGTTFVVSDGQLPGNQARWNSALIDPNAFPGSDPRMSPLVWLKGNLWDTRTYEVPVQMGATVERPAIETTREGDCLTWHAQILRVNARHNEPPTLQWTGEAGYEGDGLEPEFGTTITTFAYRVVYADPDNDPPARVVVTIERPVLPWSLTPSMTLVGWVGLTGDYVLGATYAYYTKLPAATDYLYGFSASDAWDNATGLPTGKIDAPDVGEVDGPPVAIAQASPTVAYMGTPITFDGTASRDETGIAAYRWDFGDGLTEESPVAIHQYASRTLFLVTLTVWDMTGKTGTDSLTIRIENRAPIARATATPPPVHRGQIVALDATESVEPDQDPLTFQWEQVGGPLVGLFGADTATAMFVPAELETYEFELTVDDGLGGVDETSIAVTPMNRDPVANAGPDRDAVAKNVLITLDATASTDPDGDPLTFAWTAPPGIALSDVRDPLPTFTATSSGTYSFLLRAEDGLGGTATDTVVMIVRNAPPIAIVTAPPVSLKHDSVSLDGSDSSDPDGDPLTYTWSQANGPPVGLVGPNAAIATFTPERAGTYAFRLVVADSEGAIGESTVEVVVPNALPEASLVASPTVVRGARVVTFDGADSFDADGVIVTYSFDFGDGTQSTVPDATASHAYGSSGTYLVTLAVTDDDGATDTAQANVTVIANEPPRAIATLEPAEVGTLDTTFVFDGSDSTDDVAIVAHAWDLGDGRSATGPLVSHRYSVKGPRTVRLTVTDDEGATASAILSLRIANRPPVIIASDPAASVVLAPGQLRRFAVTAVDPDADFLSYTWNLDGLAVAAAGFSVDFSSSTGTFRLNVTVSDGEFAAWHEWTVHVPASRQETNWKPLVAAVFAAVLVAMGAWSARRAPWSTGPRAQLRAFAMIGLPFALGEAATGVLSFFTGWLSIPPVLGLGTAVDLSILVGGLLVGAYRVGRRTVARRESG